MEPGQAIAAAARGTLGARFRPQGRDPAIGLDCVGVAAIAVRAGGVTATPPRSYALRGGSEAGFAAQAAAMGLAAIDPEAAGEGDLLLCDAGLGQWHLVVLTESGFVHADAGLRRVVETPGRPAWPIAGAWRARP